VHGYAPAGKDDARVRAAAALLARSGFDVAVPTIPGLTGGRLRPDDAAPVVATLTARPPAVLVAVSVGSGPALLAAAEPAARDRVRVALVLGGYASAAELLRFFLTGDYAWNGIRGHVAHDPAVVGAFIEANADLLDAATRARIAADPAGAAALLAAPPPALEALLARLSPLRVADRIRAPLVLVHGYDDPAVPYTESLRLAAARPARTRVVLVRALAHVEGAPEGNRLRALGELARLLLVFYGLGRAS
jgi:pimeloyl-ACP methyl ester carboxylesterase